MSSDPNRELSPLPSYDFTHPESAYVSSDSVRVRPTGLTIISVLSILGGIVALLSGVFGILQLLFSQMLAEAFTPQNGPGAEAQKQAQEKLNAISDQFFIPNVISMLAILVLGGFLLYCGIGLLRWKLSAADLLRKVVLFAVVFEIGRMILGAIMQYQMLPVMSEQMAASMQASSDGAGAETLEQFMKIAMIAGAVIWSVWILAKIGLMLWARAYLGRPTTRQVLE